MSSTSVELPRPVKKPRVRESCKPCRTRKTRCNAQVVCAALLTPSAVGYECHPDAQPCQSCILRGTETDCALSQPLPASRSVDPRDTASRSITDSRNLDHGNSAFLITSDPSSYRHGGPIPSPPSSDTTPVQPPYPERPADAEVARLQETIARLQADVDRLSRKGDEEVERANWARLAAILPPKATCETLLEYVVQECDWQWHSGDIIGSWTSAISRSAAPRGVISTLCISLALPAFILRKHSTPLYPVKELSLELERSLYELARSMVPEQLEDIGDISALCDICSYLIYTQEIHHLAVIVARCEALAKREGYLDENHPSWRGLSEDERRERREVMLKLIGSVRWKSIYTLRDDFADTRINICRPAFRDRSLRSPLDLDLAVDGGPAWHRPPVSSPPPQLISDATELRLLRIKSSAEVTRTKHMRICMWNLGDHAPRLVRSILRLPSPSSTATPPTPSEEAISRAEVVYRDLLRFREAEMATLGFTDVTLSQLDPTMHTQRRLAFQILVFRSGVGHYLSNLLRPWLVCADAIALAPQRPMPTRHAILARGALENAEWCMQTIPAIKALLPYPQAHLIGAFVSANLFNAATAFAVPVLRAVHAWSASECDGEEDVRALPAWPDNFYPFPVGAGPAEVERTRGPGRPGRRAEGAAHVGPALGGRDGAHDQRASGRLSPRSPSPPLDPTQSRTHTEAHGRPHAHGAACDKGSTATSTLSRPSIPTPSGTPPAHRSAPTSSLSYPPRPSAANLPRARCPGSPSPCNIKVPPTVYIDDNIKSYASNILVILDTLSLLRSNYLGKEAETRLRALVKAHGIRESHEYVKRNPPVFGFTGTGARAGIFGSGAVDLDDGRAMGVGSAAGASYAAGGQGGQSGGYVETDFGASYTGGAYSRDTTSAATYSAMDARGTGASAPPLPRLSWLPSSTSSHSGSGHPAPATDRSGADARLTPHLDQPDVYVPGLVSTDSAYQHAEAPALGAPPPFMDRDVPYGLGQAPRPGELQGGAGYDSGFVLGSSSRPSMVQDYGASAFVAGVNGEAGVSGVGYGGMSGEYADMGTSGGWPGMQSSMGMGMGTDPDLGAGVAEYGTDAASFGGFGGGPPPGVVSGAGAGDGAGGGPPAAFMDLAWLDQLLGMDASVWDGLLKDGAREVGL